jgi:hypothetical protein
MLLGGGFPQTLRVLSIFEERGGPKDHRRFARRRLGWQLAVAVLKLPSLEVLSTGNLVDASHFFSGFLDGDWDNNKKSALG